MMLGIALAEAQALLAALPIRLPMRWSTTAEAQAALDELAAQGLEGQILRDRQTQRCHDHPELWADASCSDCRSPLCSLCAATSEGPPRCSRCRAKAQRSRRFYLLRVAVLLSVLGAVLLYAYHDVRERHLRTDWRRTLTVSLVVVPEGPLDEEATKALEQRSVALEARLAREMARYRQGPPPFDLLVTVMPYGLAPAPPRPPDDPEDWWGTIVFNVQLTSWVDDVDEVAGLGGATFDASVYLVAEDANGRSTLTVEGTGQQGGRIGVVKVDLAEEMVDTTLFVVAHELFHILGASDKYDATGEPLRPEGLADPDQEPLYPQRHAEVMARHRAVSPDQSVVPEHLDELAVGPATAREIRWLEP